MAYSFQQHHLILYYKYLPASELNEGECQFHSLAALYPQREALDTAAGLRNVKGLSSHRSIMHAQMLVNTLCKTF
jgi:hypothetical protein